MYFARYLFVFIVVWQCVKCEPLVKVSQGLLRGKEEVTEAGKCYHSYQGIPYAKPPLGKLRFKPPQTPPSWFGVRKATQEGNVCKQYDILTPNRDLTGDEDCLFLNVYTPRVLSKEDSQLLPVMVWIHYGGFLYGSGNSEVFGPDWIVEQDVVLVTLNYRLGPFGFLSLDIEEASGNNGLKDQVAALQWVHENIDGFGGDPTNVTIFGNSAGSASVTYLILTDMAKGLFHKAIALSGSAFNAWAFTDKPKQNAFALCEILGHPTSSEEDAVEFLRNVPADELIEAVGKPPWSTIVNEENHPIKNLTFVPSIEKDYQNEIPLLTIPILEKLKSGNFNHVPLMIGYTNGEGILAFKDGKEDPVTYGLNGVDFSWYIPKELCLEGNPEKSREVSNKIKEFYCGENDCKDLDNETFVKIKGDTWFNRGIDKMAKLMSQYSSEPVYYYRYSFEEFGIFKNFYADSTVKGACHGDEPGYIFKNKKVKLPREDNPNVQKTHERLLQLFVNFARTGNPTPEITELLPVKWEPVTKDAVNYLSIDSELTLMTDPEAEVMKFWEDLVKNESSCDIAESSQFT